MVWGIVKGLRQLSRCLQSSLGTTNYTNHLAKEFVSFVSFVVLIIKFNVQTSKFNGNSYFTV